MIASGPLSNSPPGVDSAFILCPVLLEVVQSNTGVNLVQ